MSKKNDEEKISIEELLGDDGELKIPDKTKRYEKKIPKKSYPPSNNTNPVGIILLVIGVIILIFVVIEASRDPLGVESYLEEVQATSNARSALRRQEAAALAAEYLPLCQGANSLENMVFLFRPVVSSSGDWDIPPQIGLATADLQEYCGVYNLLGPSTQGNRAFSPTWLPDGKTIGYCQGNFVTSSFKTFDLTNYEIEEILPTQEANCGVVSPDGKYLAYAASVEDDYDIHIIDLDTREITNLTNRPGDDLHPSWHPNSQRIAFTSYGRWSGDIEEGGTGDIYIIDVQTSDVEMVVDGPKDEHEPHWSPDGAMIAYLHPRTGSSDTDINLITIEDLSSRFITLDTTKEFDSPTWVSNSEIIVRLIDPPGRITGEYELYHVAGESLGIFQPPFTMYNIEIRPGYSHDLSGWSQNNQK